MVLTNKFECNILLDNFNSIFTNQIKNQKVIYKSNEYFGYHIYFILSMITIFKVYTLELGFT